VETTHSWKEEILLMAPTPMDLTNQGTKDLDLKKNMMMITGMKKMYWV
jgi:hypothetical protein